MAIALTTLTEIKTYLGITGSTNDTLLTALAEAAEQRIFWLCDRPSGFASATQTEYFDGEFDTFLPPLTYTPVTAVASVKISTGQNTWSTLTLADLTIDGLPLDGTAFSTRVGVIGWRSQGSWAFESGQPIVRGPLIRCSPNFGGGFRRVQVVYTGGYSSIPADLEQASIAMTALLWNGRGQNEAMASETLGSYSYTRASADQLAAMMAVPTSVLSLIAPYRRRVAV